MASAPLIGNIVHYRSYGTPGGEFEPECRAAIVTEVSSKAPADANSYISVAVLNPTGLFFDRDLPQDEGRTRGGTWHYQCRGKS